MTSQSLPRVVPHLHYQNKSRVGDLGAKAPAQL